MASATKVSILLILATAACGFPRPDNVATVGGQVHGLWHGVDGVALRLQASGIDTLLTVPSDGPFRFPDQLVERASYSVTLVSNPARHTCVVESGGNGTVTATDASDVSIVCTGPEVGITLSGPWGWAFDPLKESQTFAGSIATQDVAVTVTGTTLTSVSIDHAAATVGKATDPIALPLGQLTVPVELTAAGGLTKTYQLVFDRGGALLDQVVYGKAPTPVMNGDFGRQIAISGDTLAVSGQAADGIGSVFVFVRNGTKWTQQATVRGSNTEADDRFGSSLALSGNTLAVGATGEASSATGINGMQTDNTMLGAGAVYVFVRNGPGWAQQAYIKPSDTGVLHRFGAAVALSGETLVVSGNQANVNESYNGAVYVFGRSGTTWSSQGVLTAPATAGPVLSGFYQYGAALSGDTLAVPAYEANPADGIIGRGVVQVFARTGATWTQQAYLSVGTQGTYDLFGETISLSGDTLVVTAAPYVGDLTQLPASPVYIFSRTGSTWSKQAQVTGSDTSAGDSFGTAAVVSGDTLAIGAPRDASQATGPNGGHGNGAPSAGAVYLFVREGAAWTQRTYLKASNTGAGDTFGRSLGISGDTLVVSAPGEDSGVGGVNPVPGQADDSTLDSGAIYVFR